jgi:hypothetical protein
MASSTSSVAGYQAQGNSHTTRHTAAPVALAWVVLLLLLLPADGISMQATAKEGPVAHKGGQVGSQRAETGVYHQQPK